MTLWKFVVQKKRDVMQSIVDFGSLAYAKRWDVDLT